MNCLTYSFSEFGNSSGFPSQIILPSFNTPILSAIITALLISCVIVNVVVECFNDVSLINMLIERANMDLNQ